MVRGREVLGKVVAHVSGTFLPVDAEVALVDTVPDPVETHVDCFRAALLDCVIGDSHGTFVVCGDWGWWLGIAHFFKGGSEWACFLAIDEEATHFGFGC